MSMFKHCDGDHFTLLKIFTYYVDGMSVTCYHRGAIVCKKVEEDNGVPGDNIVESRCDVFHGGSLEVCGFLVEFGILHWVVGWWWL